MILGVLILALSDMNVASKLDAFFVNLGFSIAKKTDTQVILAAILAYRVTKDVNNIIWKFEKLWLKTYGVQINNICWGESLNLLTVGMNDGKINALKVNAENKYSSYEDVNL